MNRSHSSPTLAMSVIAIAVALALAACGSSSGSPASPAETAAPSVATGGPAPSRAAPSPSILGTQRPATDVAASFIKILGSGAFRANATIAGEMTLGSATFSLTGTSAFNGPDSHQTMTVAIPGAPQRVETLTVGGVSYIDRGGLWFQKPAESPGSGSTSDFNSAMRSMIDVTDVGIETRNGESLHHLKTRESARTLLSALGVADPAGDGTMAFDVYARDDGTPVVMAIAAAWTDVAGSARQPVTLNVDFVFSNVGGQVVIEKPAQVWATFNSKRFGYSIAYPSDWEKHPSGGKTKPDAIESAEGSGVYVYRSLGCGCSLNTVTSVYVNTIRHSVKAKVTSNTVAKVAGVRARRLEWSAVYDGTRVWNVQVLLVRGKYVYSFDYGSLEKTSDSDRALVDDFLSSLTLPR
jgi:hypothetical protein